MSKYRLTYFDARGRAEVARLLCAAAGKDFEDIRIPVPNSENNQNQAWLSIKERAPFGQLPMLEVDEDFVLAQSHAIERFLAKEFDMLGGDSFEEAEVDMFMESIGDLITMLVTYHFMENDEDVKARMKRQFFFDTGPTLLALCEIRLALSSSGFLVGDSITAADLCLLDLQSWVASVFPDDCPLLFGPNANVLTNIKFVSSLPGIAKWLEKRPKTAF